LQNRIAQRLFLTSAQTALRIWNVLVPDCSSNQRRFGSSAGVSVSKQTATSFFALPKNLSRVRIDISTGKSGFTPPGNNGWPFRMTASADATRKIFPLGNGKSEYRTRDPPGLTDEVLLVKSKRRGERFGAAGGVSVRQHNHQNL